MLNKKLSGQDGARALIMVIAAVFAAEFGIMMFFRYLMPAFSPFVESLVDGIILIALIYPVLYFAVYCPMRRYIKEKNTAYEKSEEIGANFRSVVSSAKDAIIMIDDSGRISLWNDVAEKMFGFVNEEALGKDLHQLIVPERFRERFLKGFTGFKSTGEGPVIGRIVEVEALRKSGQEFPIELSLSAVKVKGLWSAIGIVRDISERKKFEAELKEKVEYLERLNKAMVGRELKIVDLKKEIRRLREKASV